MSQTTDRGAAGDLADARTSSQAFAAPVPSDLLKRAFDLSVALTLLVTLSPLFVGVALMMARLDPGPIFYGHKRVGRHGQIFHCLKFRTMRCDGDAILARHLEFEPAARREWQETRKLKSDPRVTRLGSVLRRTSLDELPQLMNVIRGEMSLVGPRPVVRDELSHYGEHKQAYLAVRPGITGLWQISGRNDVGYATRVSLDAHYVKTRSFAGDTVILMRTAFVVFLQRGSY